MKKTILSAFVLLFMGMVVCAQVEPLPTDAQTAQQINAYKFNANDLFTLFNAPTNFVVDVQDDLLNKGTEVRQVHPQGAQLLTDGHNQEWVFLYAGIKSGLPVYRIMNYGFRRFLTAGAGDGAFVTTESFRMVNQGGADAQLWFIIPTSNDSHILYIKSTVSGVYLQAPDNTTAEFERYSCKALSAVTQQNAKKKFVLQTSIIKLKLNRTKLSVSGVDANISIRPRYSENIFINIPGGNLANGANLLSLRQSPFDTYNIKETASGVSLYRISVQDRREKCFMRYRSTLNPEHDGIILWECDEAHRIDQEWYIIPSIREQDTYIIINKNTGQALTAKDRETANGTLLIMVDFQDGENQRWVIK